MSDEDKKETPVDGAPEGSKKDSDDGGDGNAPESSYQKLKASHSKLEETLTAVQNSAAAERRKQEERISTLEESVKANDKPKEDTERIANLEIELARSKAVSKFGLSEDDAGLLKGSPEDILKDAEYWAKRLEEKPAPDTKPDTSNRDLIDKKVDDDQTKKADPPPKPKKGNLSWMEEYKQADPKRRAEMDKAVLDGDVDPRPSKQ